MSAQAVQLVIASTAHDIAHLLKLFVTKGQRTSVHANAYCIAFIGVKPFDSKGGE